MKMISKVAPITIRLVTRNFTRGGGRIDLKNLILNIALVTKC